MQVRALKTFSNQAFGLVRTGLVITAPDGLAGQWIRNGLAEKFNGPHKGPKPDRNKAFNEAPRKSQTPRGNESAEVQETPHTPPESEPRPVDGKTKLVSSARLGRRSRKKT